MGVEIVNRFTYSPLNFFSLMIASAVRMRSLRVNAFQEKQAFLREGNEKPRVAKRMFLRPLQDSEIEDEREGEVRSW